MSDWDTSKLPVEITYEAPPVKSAEERQREEQEMVDYVVGRLMENRREAWQVARERDKFNDCFALLGALYALLPCLMHNTGLIPLWGALLLVVFCVISVCALLYLPPHIERGEAIEQ